MALRSFLFPTLTLLALAFPATAQTTAAAGATYNAATDTLVYVGTYTNNAAGSKGIYMFKLDTPAGTAGPTLVPLGLAAETTNPSFLTVDPIRGLVFAVNETQRTNDQPTGGVSAFRIDRATGKLTLINQVFSMGTDPCHITLDKTGRTLFVANYSSGSLAVIPVAADGRLGEPVGIQHTGKGAHPQRQAGPHAHAVTLDAANRHALVCDLGIDQVLTYTFDVAAGKLSPASPPSVATKPGAGPRHLALVPNEKFAYVLNELDSTIGIYAYTSASGSLQPVGTISSLPPGSTGRNSTAEILVHPSGKWVYASNRGHNSIAAFVVNATSGALTFVDALSSGGRTPRHFDVTPDAGHLLIANQGTNNIIVAKIDEATGKLTATGAAVDAPAPVCVVFLGPKK